MVDVLPTPIHEAAPSLRLRVPARGERRARPRGTSLTGHTRNRSYKALRRWPTRRFAVCGAAREGKVADRARRIAPPGGRGRRGGRRAVGFEEEATGELRRRLKRGGGRRRRGLRPPDDVRTAWSRRRSAAWRTFSHDTSGHVMTYDAATACEAFRHGPDGARYLRRQARVTIPTATSPG